MPLILIMLTLGANNYVKKYSYLNNFHLIYIFKSTLEAA